jgi:hypothetical protein
MTIASPSSLNVMIALEGRATTGLLPIIPILGPKNAGRPFFASGRS